MLPPPSHANQRYAYALVQELLSGLNESHADNMRFLARRASELTGNSVSLYSRFKFPENQSGRYVAATCNVDMNLVGTSIPDDCGGADMAMWCRKHIGIAPSLSRPVSLKGETIGHLMILADESRQLTIEEYDAIEALRIVLSYIEGKHDWFDAARLRNHFMTPTDSGKPAQSGQPIREELLHDICRNLTSHDGVHNVCIGLVDETGRPDGRIFHAGFNPDQSQGMREMFTGGELPYCAKHALDTPGPQLIPYSFVNCRSCLISKEHDGFGCISVQISFASRKYGWLTARVPNNSLSDQVILAILADLGESLGLLLHEQELDRQHLETQYQREAMLERFEQLSALRLEQVKMMQRATVGEILQKTIDKAEAWTGSSIGFFHFVDEQSGTISLQGWSTRTVGHMCKAKDITGHYQIEDAGIWADAARQKRTVIHNDYASAPGKKGLPEGHAEITRMIQVPIIRQQQVKAIVGLGNKESLYDNDDGRWISALADQTWEIIENKLFLEYQETLKSQLEHAKKMEMIGNFAAGITHEINNPLAFIRVSIANLEQDIDLLSGVVSDYRLLIDRVEQQAAFAGDVAPIREKEHAVDIASLLGDMPAAVDSIKRGVERITDITRSMRNLTFKNVTDAKAPADLNRLIRDAIVIASSENTEVAEIRALPGKIPMVDCNPTQINQVLLNLLINSLHAIKLQNRKSPGSIVVSTWADASHVYSSVVDDGPGIAESIRPEVFTPFFTTKKSGFGTGLGLSISYDIVVRKHQGSLTFSCPPEGGTAFTMSLPL